MAGENKESPLGDAIRRRADLSGVGNLRRHTARGTLVNAAYFVGLYSLGLIKGFLVAAFLTRTDYGLWGILVIGLGTLLWLKQVGIGDKYVQQDEADQELAFQKAFTLELAFYGLVPASCSSPPCPCWRSSTARRSSSRPGFVASPHRGRRRASRPRSGSSTGGWTSSASARSRRSTRSWVRGHGRAGGGRRGLLGAGRRRRGGVAAGRRGGHADLAVPGAAALRPRHAAQLRHLLLAAVPGRRRRRWSSRSPRSSSATKALGLAAVGGIALAVDSPTTPTGRPDRDRDALPGHLRGQGPHRRCCSSRS